jgi:hypothetical protein
MIATTVSFSSQGLRHARQGFRALLGCLAATLLSAAICLLSAAICHAGDSAVVDSGEFFSEKAESDAARVIAETARTLHRDIAVETFHEIPANLKARLNSQDKAGRDQFFEDWALKQAKRKGVNGVFLLLVREPTHFHAVMGSETQKHAFTPEDCDALLKRTLPKLQKQRYDELLRDSVHFIATRMKSRANTRR